MAAVHKGVVPMYHLPDTAMNTNGPTSRLALMQAKFQQKQLEEKERKLLALYEDQAHQAYQRVGQGGGKVRQLFQERRTHHQTGLDRSYPLEPIYDNRREPRGASLDRSQNGSWKNQTARRSKSQVRKQPEPQEDYQHVAVNNNYEEHQVLNNSFKNQNILFGDENDYLTKAANDLDSSRVFRKLPNIGALTLAQAYENKSKKDSPVNKITDYQNNMSPAKEPELKKSSVQSKVNDVASITKSMSKVSTTPARKTEVKPATTFTSSTRAKSVSTTPSTNNKRTTPSPTLSSGSSRPASNTTPKDSPYSNTTPKTMKPATLKGVRANMTTAKSDRPASANLASCKICSRNFATDRVKAHEEICAKTTKKKRKVFDPVKQRLRGTEAEPYLRKGKPPPPPPLTKSNWRKKHEDFISNIRAAKVAQAHVAKGGKLTDLPPPPPMDTSDLIPCPHCGRKFNETAAARHIPLCANMLHNKPKPGAAKGGPVKRR